MVSNFRTYEAQSRLLAAVIASHPTLKLNFKAITQHFGSDVTESVIRHRLRPVKLQADVLRQAVDKGEDAKDLSHMFSMSEKEIHKHFGESTALGIEFQFRQVRKDAKTLRDAVAKGESPLTALASTPSSSRGGSGSGTGGFSTPTSKRRMVTPASSGGRAAKRANTGSTAATPSRRRRPAASSRALDLIVLSNEEDASSSLGEDVDYEQLDLTPRVSPLPDAAHLPTTTTMSTMTMADAAATVTAGFVPDVTPALSTGTTPSEQSEAAADVFSTRRPSAVPAVAGASSLFQGRPVFDVDNDDFEDIEAEGDFVFGLDTPSKAPRVVKTDVASSATASVAASFDSYSVSAPTMTSSFATEVGSTWHAPSSYDRLSSATIEPFHSFGTGSPSWAHDPPAPASVSSSAANASFAHEFYDNDGAI